MEKKKKGGKTRKKRIKEKKKKKMADNQSTDQQTGDCNAQTIDILKTYLKTSSMLDEKTKTDVQTMMQEIETDLKTDVSPSSAKDLPKEEDHVDKVLEPQPPVPTIFITETEEKSQKENREPSISSSLSPRPSSSSSPKPEVTMEKMEIPKSLEIQPREFISYTLFCDYLTKMPPGSTVPFCDDAVELRSVLFSGQEESTLVTKKICSVFTEQKKEEEKEENNGKDGKDGKDGKEEKDGKDGKDGKEENENELMVGYRKIPTKKIHLANSIMLLEGEGESQNLLTVLKKAAPMLVSPERTGITMIGLGEYPDAEMITSLKCKVVLHAKTLENDLWYYGIEESCLNPFLTMPYIIPDDDCDQESEKNQMIVVDEEYCTKHYPNIYCCSNNSSNISNNDDDDANEENGKEVDVDEANGVSQVRRILKHCDGQLKVRLWKLHGTRLNRLVPHCEMKAKYPKLFEMPAHRLAKLVKQTTLFNRDGEFLVEGKTGILFRPVGDSATEQLGVDRGQSHNMNPGRRLVDDILVDSDFSPAVCLVETVPQLTEGRAARFFGPKTGMDPVDHILSLC